MLNEQIIKETLRSVIDPDTSVDVVSSDLISGITLRGGKVGFLITIDPKDKERKAHLRDKCEAAVKAIPGVEAVTAVLTAQNAEPIPPGTSGYTQPRERANWNLTPLEHVGKVIAVASGKGGVGKSTTTVNLAHALTASGKRVGILDADIYGPSIPRMLGLYPHPNPLPDREREQSSFQEKGHLITPSSFQGEKHLKTPSPLQGEGRGEGPLRPAIENGKMIPLQNHGIKANSIGFISGDEAAILRGPMISKALTQLLRFTRWGSEKEPLDYLLVDMPPGTGDVHISMAQLVPLSGAIIVTTPQEVAVIDARKCALTFQKLGVPLLGVIENMSGDLFGSGGGKQLAQEFAIPFLGEVPADKSIREAMDGGQSSAAASYQLIAGKVLHG